MASVFLSGCSLLKVSVSTGEPLPETDMQLRMATRGFYRNFQNKMVEVADSVARLSGNTTLKMRTLQWKIQITRMGISAAMQSIPEVSALETWMLYNNLSETCEKQPDSLLFFQYTPVFQEVISHTEKAYEQLLSDILPESRFDLMRDFVQEHTQVIAWNDKSTTSSYWMDWINYLKAKGMEYNYPVGSVSEAVAEVGGKMEGYAGQLSNNLSWRINLLDYQMREDSIYTSLNAQIDSLNRDFERITLVMEHFPEISDHMMAELNGHVQTILGSFNNLINSSFANFDYQRAELQTYISQEREQLMADFHVTAEDIVQAVLDSLPRLVGKIICWIILFLLVLLGVPLTIGFLLGKAYGQKRANQKARSKKLPGSTVPVTDDKDSRKME